MHSHSILFLCLLTSLSAADVTVLLAGVVVVVAGYEPLLLGVSVTVLMAVGVAVLLGVGVAMLLAGGVAVLLTGGMLHALPAPSTATTLMVYVVALCSPVKL